jgi:hypothetical protein
MLQQNDQITIPDITSVYTFCLSEPMTARRQKYFMPGYRAAKLQ